VFARRRIRRLAEQQGADGLLLVVRDAGTTDEERALAMEHLATLSDAGALSESQKREASAFARASVLDDDKAVRTWALALLSMLGDELAGPSAIRAVADQEPSVRTAAIIALANNDVSGREQALTRLLDDKEPPVRQMAAGALAEIGALGSVPRLRERLEREDDQHARSALEEAIATLEGRSGA
jgi:HEAT repeat protein